MKEIICPQCGSRQFTLVYEDRIIADFSQEGAVEGHPHLRFFGKTLHKVHCSVCRVIVSDELAQEIEKEVL